MISRNSTGIHTVDAILGQKELVPEGAVEVADAYQLSESLGGHGQQNSALVSLPHDLVGARLAGCPLEGRFQRSIAAEERVVAHVEVNTILDLLEFGLC